MIYIVNTLFIVFIRTIKGVFFIIKINSRKIYFVEEITYNLYQIFRKYVDFILDLENRFGYNNNLYFPKVCSKINIIYKDLLYG